MAIVRIDDLAAAAYIVARGIPLLRCELASPKRCSFLFEDHEGQVTSLAGAYLFNEPVGARTYYHALQDVRLIVNRTLNAGGAR